ncbi:MAG: hypothetical protein IK125_06840 [Lachnospiraceae bacterium]|nr:hypothetical protein [Lachnospiraceae bacterium]
MIDPNAQGVKIIPENFPDEIFREYASIHFDENNDGALSDDEETELIGDSGNAIIQK